ncbi:hypothetical protein GQ43DRAFT_133210 [Delitschia confertaspora ATCC 74209]|uniref:C4-dicarboxylate transporter/malic acid transport protein n=1 Tax=Delitschia confertaspora ATCC 74209 TaxID=1513339 RepID=A0A9P4MQ71_9PLEO|nr:hypothetical protein GQ43DRAFT_133210 [Delitschia confertaspora ATCC 74209]
MYHPPHEEESHSTILQQCDDSGGRSRDTSQQSQEKEDVEGQDQRKVGLRERLKHFTWAWFTGTMSSGGIGILLAQTPHRFRGLYTIGVVVFIFHLAFFVLLCSLMATRAFLHPRHFLRSLIRPVECFYVGSFWLSIATIIGCIQEYGITLGPERDWLITAVRVLFWIYTGVTMLSSWLQFFWFFRTTPQNVHAMNPAWLIPAYAPMLTGTIAAVIAPYQPSRSRMPIIVAGVSYQGFGYCSSFLLVTIYFIRLINSGLPMRDQRPGMFFPVGFIGYTITALTGLSQAVPRDYGYFAAHPSAADTVATMALWTGIFLWVFGFFLFSLAVIACVESIPKMGFTLAWWAFVFPNIGFTLATINIGTQLGSEGILWVTSIMTILLVVIWLFGFGALVRAVWIKRIMWPGRDDDKDI